MLSEMLAKLQVHIGMFLRFNESQASCLPPAFSHYAKLG